MTEIDILIKLLMKKMPANVSQYAFVMDWYADGGGYEGSGRYLKEGETIKPTLPFEEAIEILKVAEKIAVLKRGNESNRVTLNISRDGTYDCKADFVESLDEDREDEIRMACGDADSEILLEKGKEYKERALGGQAEMTPNEPLSLDRLCREIREDVQGSLLVAWTSMVLKTEITRKGEKQRMETDFFLQADDGREILFEPENPIAPMNTLLKIKDILDEDGKDRNEWTVILHANGEAEIENDL